MIENKDVDCLNKIIDNYSKRIVIEDDLNRKTNYMNITRLALNVKMMIQKTDMKSLI